MSKEFEIETLRLYLNVRLMQACLLELLQQMSENGTKYTEPLKEPMLWVEKIEKKEG